MLELQSISTLRGGFLLGPVAFTVPAGSHTFLMGPTGTGKTSLLEIVAGLRTPSAAECCSRGATSPRGPPAIGASVTFRKTRRFSRIDRPAKHRLRLGHPRGAPKRNQYPHLRTRRELGAVDPARPSGGRLERRRSPTRRPRPSRRISTAIAITRRTDERARRRVEIRIVDFLLRESTTVLHVTHDRDHIDDLADSILEMNNIRSEVPPAA